MSKMCVLYHLMAICFVLLIVIGGSFILARYKRLWYLVALGVTPWWVYIVYHYGVGAGEWLWKIFTTYTAASVYGCIILIALPIGYLFVERRARRGASKLTNDARMEYIYKSHEAFTKETAALRTLITTLASGSLVAIRAITMNNPADSAPTRALLFCLLSVACVLFSNVASLVSIEISMSRAKDLRIQMKDLKDCSNFIEHVLLFWGVVALIVGYYSFSVYYVH